jgi:hypothetical protein
MAPAEQTVVGPTEGSRSARFALAALSFLLVYVAAGAPSPFYPVYRIQWDLSSFETTALFAVYALGLLVALLLTGSLSDHVGRRPVVVSGIAAVGAACLLIALAASPWWVAVGRVLQGLGTGAVTAALGGVLGDLSPPDNPGRGALVTSMGGPAGIAFGALVAGALLESAAAPAHLTFVGLAALLFLVSVVAGRALPAPSGAEEFRWGLLRPHVSVPPSVRDMFIALAPITGAIWALGGLYLALGPSLVTDVLGQDNHLVAAVVVAAFNLAAAVAGIATRRTSPARMIEMGTALLLAGVAVGALALRVDSLALFLVGAAASGSGFGPTFAGVFRETAGVAPPERRAGVVAAIFIVSYVSNAIPAIAAGLAEPGLGLQTVFDVYGGLVIFASLVALLLFRRADATGRGGARAAS